jgi:transmembrane sensor
MENEIADILIRHFHGPIDAKERQELEKWLAKEGNQQVYDAYKQVWELSARQDGGFEPSVDAQWERFNMLLDQPHKLAYIGPIEKRQPKVMGFSRKTLRVAAALAGFLLIASVVVSYLSRNHQAGNWVVLESGGQVKTITLPDNSKVTLNKGAEIKYPEQFASGNRLVKLSGEAYFEVVQSGAGVFKVETDKTWVTVLGTEFNVDASHPDKVELMVTKGKVRFAAINNGHEEIYMAGEAGTFSMGKNAMAKGKIKDVNAMAYKTRVLVFDDHNVHEVIKHIEAYFHIKVNAPENIKNYTYTGSFSNPGLESFFEVFSLTLGVPYHISGDTVTLGAMQ